MVLLSGCDNNLDTDNIVDDQITIIGSNWYGHAPVWIGIERGIFAKHGFKVKWLYISSSLDRIKAVDTDAAQFASVGQISMLNAMVEDVNGFYWVGSQDNSPGLEGLVAHKNISSISGLKGKRIGLPFNSSVEITLRQLLEEHSLKPGKDVELINLNVGDIPAVFRAGYVDAALIWEPAFSTLQDISGTEPLATDMDTKFFIDFRVMAGPDVLVMSKAWHDYNPLRAKRFMEAYFESVEWVKKKVNLEQTAELAQGTYIRQPLEKIIQNLDKIKWKDAVEQRNIMSESKMYAQTNHLLDLLQKYNNLPDDKRPDYKKWVNLNVYQ